LYDSVVNFTDRVFTALLEQKVKVVKWPSASERKEISDRFAENHGLEGAVGIVDGTPVNLSACRLGGVVQSQAAVRYERSTHL
jgi:hypothetical protein